MAIRRSPAGPDARDVWPGDGATGFSSPACADTLDAWAAALAAVGARYLVGIAPSKQPVYSDMLPRGMPGPRNENLAGRLGDHLPGNAFDLLDVRDCLLEAREHA